MISGCTLIKQHRTSSQKDASSEGYCSVLKVQTEVVDGQKTQLDIKKHGGGMMVLVIVLVRSGNYRKSKNRRNQVRRTI